MQKFFRKHPDFVLITLSVIFLAVLVAYFFWGITTLVVSLSGSVNPGKLDKAVVRFNVEEAAKLNLKGALNR